MKSYLLVISDKFRGDLHAGFNSDSVPYIGEHIVFEDEVYLIIGKQHYLEDGILTRTKIFVRKAQ